MPLSSVDTRLADDDARAVRGDVELGDPGGIGGSAAIAGALQAFERVAARVGRDDLGRAVVEIAIVDRDVAGEVVAVGLELGRRAEDEMVAVGREPLLDEAVVGRGVGRFDRSLHTLDEAAVGQVHRHSLSAVGEARVADFRAREGECPERRVGFRQGRGERFRRERIVRGDPDVGGRPTGVASGRDVWVDAAVGRVAGNTRDRTAVDPVEDPQRALGAGVPFERNLGPGPASTRRRIRRRCAAETSS